MHALTQARTLVRARGQTDRDKEHFRRCTGRPRSAYLLLLARRGRRTRGRVTPECPRFLLSVPSPFSPSFSSCLSCSLALFVALLFPLSKPWSGPRRFTGYSPSLGYERYLLLFSNLPFSLAPSLSLSLRSCLSSGPPCKCEQTPRSISFYTVSCEPCEPGVRWNWSPWTTAPGITSRWSTSRSFSSMACDIVTADARSDQ